MMSRKGKKMQLETKKLTHDDVAGIVGSLIGSMIVMSSEQITRAVIYRMALDDQFWKAITEQLRIVNMSVDSKNDLHVSTSGMKRMKSGKNKNLQ